MPNDTKPASDFDIPVVDAEINAENTMSDKNEPISFEYRLDSLLEGDGAGTHVQYDNGRWTRKYGDWDNPRTRHYDGFGKTEAERKGETTHVKVNERELYEAMTVARREYENAYARLRNLEKLIQHIPLVKNRRDRGLNEPHLDGFVEQPKKAEAMKPAVEKEEYACWR